MCHGEKQKSSRQTQQPWAAKGQACVPDSEPETPQASPWGRSCPPCPEYTWLLLHRLGSAVETVEGPGRTPAFHTWHSWAYVGSTPFRGRKNLALPDEKIPFVIGAQVRRARWQQLWRASAPWGFPAEASLTSRPQWLTKLTPAHVTLVTS